MIVTLQLPAGSSRAKYGRANIDADQNGQIQVADFVAFTLLKVIGVTLVSGVASGSALSLLQAAEADYETNYIFQAYGRKLPDAPRLAAAVALMTANGEPSASLS